jgi:hypothetical protein
MRYVKYSKPRLSDEEMDPLEADDLDAFAGHLDPGWVPWDVDDLIDIRRIIDERMPPKQRQVMEALLNGISYTDIGVSEKYWRYHYEKAIDFIKKEMKL